MHADTSYKRWAVLGALYMIIFVHAAAGAVEPARRSLASSFSSGISFPANSTSAPNELRILPNFQMHMDFPGPADPSSLTLIIENEASSSAILQLDDSLVGVSTLLSFTSDLQSTSAATPEIVTMSGDLDMLVEGGMYMFYIAYNNSGIPSVTGALAARVENRTLDVSIELQAPDSPNAAFARLSDVLMLTIAASDASLHFSVSNLTVGGSVVAVYEAAAAADFDADFEFLPSIAAEHHAELPCIVTLNDEYGRSVEYTEDTFAVAVVALTEEPQLDVAFSVSGDEGAAAATLGDTILVVATANSPLVNATLSIPGLDPIELSAVAATRWSASFVVTEGMEEGALQPSALLFDVTHAKGTAAAVTQPVTLDTTGPSVVDAYPLHWDDTTMKAGDTLTLVTVWSEALAWVNASVPVSLTLSSGGSATLAGVAGANATFTYTVGEGDATSEGGLSVIGGVEGAPEAFADAVGNAAVYAWPQVALSDPPIAVDGVPPALASLSCVSLPGNYGPSSSLSFTLQFTEVVTTTQPLALTLSNGGIALAAPLSSSVHTFTYAVSGDNATEALDAVSFTPASITTAADAAGNTVPAALPAGVDSLGTCGYAVVDSVTTAFAVASEGPAVVYEPPGAPATWNYTLTPHSVPSVPVTVRPVLQLPGAGAAALLEGEELLSFVSVVPSEAVLQAGEEGPLTFMVVAAADDRLWAPTSTGLQVQVSHTVTTSDPNFAGGVDLIQVVLMEDESDSAAVTLPAGSAITEGGGLEARLVLASRPGLPVSYSCTVNTTMTFGGEAGPDFLLSPVSGDITAASWDEEGVVLQLFAPEDSTRWTPSGQYPFTIACRVTSSLGQDTTTSPVTVTISDNDTPSLTTLSSDAADGFFITFDEGEETAYRVGLSTRPLGTTEVTVVSTSELLQVTPTHFIFTAGNWSDGGLVTVTAVNDHKAISMDRAQREVQLLHSVTSNDASYNGLADVTRDVRITDDDVVGVTMNKVFLEVYEDPTQGNPSASYTVALTSQPSAAVTLTPQLVDLLTGVVIQSQANINPTSLQFTPENWDTPVSVSVTAALDTIQEQSPMMFRLRHVGASSDDAYSENNLGELRVAIRDRTTQVDNSPAPTLASAVLQEDAEVLVVAFSGPTDMAGKAVGAAQTCEAADVFTAATLAMFTGGGAASATCTWTSNATLSIALPESHSVAPGDAVTLEGGRLRASANGVNFASGAIAVTGRAPVPQPQHAAFSSSGALIDIAFSSATTGRVAVTGAPSGPCTALFKDAAQYLGATAVCTWQDDATLRVTLGAGATILPQPLTSAGGRLCQAGRSLVPLPGAITAALHSVRSASLCIDTFPPTPPPAARAALAVTVGGRCNPVFIDATPSSGGAGRSLAFAWSYASAAPAEDLQALDAAIRNAPLSSIPSMISLAAGALPVEVAINVTVSVTNYFGSVDSTTASFSVSSQVIPSLVLSTNDVTTYRNKRTVVRAQGSIPQCDTTLASLALLYEWRLVSAVQTYAFDATAYPLKDVASLVAVWTSGDPRVLSIPAKELQAGVRYVFEAETALAEDPSLSVTSRVTVVGGIAGVTAVISGGNRPYSTTTGFTLSGESSQDLDEFTLAGVPLQYSWNCTIEGSPCTTQGGSPVTSSAATLEVAADALAEGTYTITLEVSSGTRGETRLPYIYRSAVAATEVTLVPDVPPSITLTPILTKANPKFPPVLRATVEAAEGDTLTGVEWQVLQKGVALPAAAQTAILGADKTLLTLPLRANALSGGLTYQFRLDVTQALSPGVTSASLSVVVNTPPSSGTIRLNPTSGTVVLDSFTMATENWADAPEDLPLTYWFSFVRGTDASSTNNNRRDDELGATDGFTSSATLRGVLPPLGAEPDYIVSVVAYARDTLGSIGRTTTLTSGEPAQLTVTPVESTGGGDVLGQISSASDGIIERSQQEANVGTLLNGVSAVVSAIAPTSECSCEGTEVCFPDTGSCLAPVDAEWSEWSDWSGCSLACETEEDTGVEYRTRVCTPPLLGGQSCAAVAQAGGFTADEYEERPCADVPACNGTVIDAVVGPWELAAACNATCDAVNAAAAGTAYGVEVYERSCLPPSPQGQPCPTELQTLQACSIECAALPLPCPGPTVTVADAAAGAVRNVVLQCSGQGDCLRSPVDCSAEDPECAAVCVCDEGWFGAECSLTETEFASLKGIRNSLLQGVESLQAGEDDEAQSQQASAIEGISDDVSQLGDEQRDRILALIGDITSFLGARRRRRRRLQTSDGGDSSISNQTGTSYTNGASGIMKQYVDDKASSDTASRLLVEVPVVGPRHLAQGTLLRRLVAHIAATSGSGSALLAGQQRRRALSAEDMASALEAPLHRSELATHLLSFVDALSASRSAPALRRSLHAAPAGHDDHGALITAALRRLVDSSVETAKAAVEDGVNVVKGVVGSVVAGTVANSDPVVMPGKHVHITSKRADDTSNDGGSVASNTGVAVTMTEAFEDTVDTQVLEWQFNPRTYAANGSIIVAKVVTVDLLNGDREPVGLQRPAILRLPVSQGAALEDFKCAYGVESGEGWDRQGLTLVRFTNATGHSVAATAEDVAFGECASTHFSDFSYLEIPGLPTFNIVNPFTDIGLLSTLFNADNLFTAIWLLSMAGFFVLLWFIAIFADWRHRRVLRALRTAMFLRYGKVTDNMLDYWAYEKYDPQVQDLMKDDIEPLEKLKLARARRLQEAAARRLKASNANTLTTFTSSLWQDWWTRMKSEHIWMAIYTAPTDERVLLTTPQRVWIMACIVFMAMTVNAVFTGEDPQPANERAFISLTSASCMVVTDILFPWIFKHVNAVHSRTISEKYQRENRGKEQKEKPVPTPLLSSGSGGQGMQNLHTKSFAELVDEVRKVNPVAARTESRVSVAEDGGSVTSDSEEDEERKDAQATAPAMYAKDDVATAVQAIVRGFLARQRYKRISHILAGWHRRFIVASNREKQTALILKQMKKPLRPGSQELLVTIDELARGSWDARHSYREAVRTQDAQARARAEHQWFQHLLQLERAAHAFRSHNIDRSDRKRTVGAQLKALDRLLDAETDSTFDFADRSPPALFGRTWDRLEINQRSRHAKDKKLWNILLFLVIHFAWMGLYSILVGIYVALGSAGEGSTEATGFALFVFGGALIILSVIGFLAETTSRRWLAIICLLLSLAAEVVLYAITASSDAYEFSVEAIVGMIFGQMLPFLIAGCGLGCARCRHKRQKHALIRLLHAQRAMKRTVTLAEMKALRKLQAIARSLRARRVRERYEELQRWTRLNCQRSGLTFLLYLSVGGITVFFFYLLLLYGIKFSSEQAEGWLIASFIAFGIDIFVQEPLVLLFVCMYSLTKKVAVHGELSQLKRAGAIPSTKVYNPELLELTDKPELSTVKT